MTRTNQKLEEVYRVEQMRQALGGSPPGQVEPADEPDVLVVRDGRRTGVEVTELHQRSEHGKGPRRLQESERFGIVARAQALAEASPMPVVDVAVHFQDAVQITKDDRHVIVDGLVGLVSRNMPAPDGSVVLELWRQRDNPLPWIRTVRLYRASVFSRHHWAVPDSGWVQVDFVQELQLAIDDKNAKHGRYRQYCDECWLLIVASGGRPSGLFEPSDETKNHVYRSSFTRTLFMEAFSGRLVELHTTAA